MPIVTPPPPRANELPELSRTCPRCGQVYTEAYRYCLADRTELVDERSIDPPTAEPEGSLSSIAPRAPMSDAPGPAEQDLLELVIPRRRWIWALAGAGALGVATVVIALFASDTSEPKRPSTRTAKYPTRRVAPAARRAPRPTPRPTDPRSRRAATTRARTAASPEVPATKASAPPTSPAAPTAAQDRPIARPTSANRAGIQRRGPVKAARPPQRQALRRRPKRSARPTSGRSRPTTRTVDPFAE